MSAWRAALSIGICPHDRLLRVRFFVAGNVKLRERLAGKCQEISTYVSFAAAAAVKLHLFLGIQVDGGAFRDIFDPLLATKNGI